MKYIVFVIFINIFFTAKASSNSKGQTIEVVTEILSPFQFIDKNGDLSGYMTEVVQELFKQTQDVANIRVLPWARALKTAQMQSDVMIFSIAKTKNRESRFLWIGEMPSAPVYLWGLVSQAVKKPFDDLTTLRVATIRGSNVVAYLQNHKFEFVVPVNEESKLIDMLALNRVDLIASSERGLKERIKGSALKFTQLVKVQKLVGLNVNLGIAFNINSNPELIKKYQQAFNKLQNNGQLAAIKKRWAFN